MNPFKKFFKWVFKGLVRFTYTLSIVYLGIRYRPKVIYKDKKLLKKTLKETPCVFICNHTSHNDGFFVPRMLKKYKVYTFVARDWYEKKFAKPFFECLDYIPMDRKEMDTAWLAEGIAKIKAGYSILIFPEGRTSKGDMNEFKPGFLYLSKRTGAKVVPMCLSGGYKSFRQKLVIGTPLDMDLNRRGRPSEVLSGYALSCREEIGKLIGECVAQAA